MAELRSHVGDRCAEREQVRGERVPEVVQAEPRQLRLRQQRPEALVDGRRLEGRARFRGNALVQDMGDILPIDRPNLSALVQDVRDILHIDKRNLSVHLRQYAHQVELPPCP